MMIDLRVDSATVVITDTVSFDRGNKDGFTFCNLDLTYSISSGGGDWISVSPSGVI